jgi:predicted SnoaL-like aldol condensation-catalyzing enzyme
MVRTTRRLRHNVAAALFGAVALLAGRTALAQGAPPGVRHIAVTRQETAAKQVLINFGKLVDAGKVDLAFQLYVSPQFVDHSDRARAMMHKAVVGYADSVPFFKAMVRPGAPQLVQKVTADDDIVTVQGLLGQDIFRVEHGQITDHWDTLGSTPGALAADQSAPDGK